MHSAFINYKNSKIHYAVAGNGKHPVICLHGYGETIDSFKFLEADLPASLKLIAIDLPFHGNTDWKEGLNFLITDFIIIIDDIFRNLKIEERKYSVMAYSMGGRVALHLTEEIPERIQKLILLAPDGIKLNFWYWLATQSYLGNGLFNLTMKKPKWFLGFLNGLHKMKMVNPSIHKFVRYYIHDDRVREELYERWTGMRKIRPDHRKLKSYIREYKIPVALLYGKFDRIIRVEPGERFRNGIEPYCNIEMLDSGHQVLREKNIPVILKWLR